MLCRLYFVLTAAAILSPMSKLYAKRICHERGLNIDFVYLMKTSMHKYPGFTYMMILLVSVLGMAQLLRIFERPYYSLCFDPPIEDFRTLESAFFFVIMTMASAGFGDITTSTRAGRWMTLAVACWGAIMLSLLFTIIGDIFYLEGHLLAPLFLVGETKMAGRAVYAALQYNAIKRRRYKLLEEGEVKDIPTINDVKAAKFAMELALKNYKKDF